MKIGSRIRYFDFAGVNHTYIEGVVVDNIKQGTLVRVTKDVYCGAIRTSARHGRINSVFCVTPRDSARIEAA